MQSPDTLQLEAWFQVELTLKEKVATVATSVLVSWFAIEAMWFVARLAAH